MSTLIDSHDQHWFARYADNAGVVHKDASSEHGDLASWRAPERDVAAIEETPNKVWSVNWPPLPSVHHTADCHNLVYACNAARLCQHKKI